MKQIQLTLLFFSLYLTTALSQAPSNDECNNAIDLGIAPTCQAEVAYTNINATTSSAAFPSCFEGTEGSRDVWFSFTTNPDIREYTITIKGLANGPNGQRIGNPQVTLYRGNCNSLSELSCSSSENGSDEVKLEVFNVPGNRTFFLRVNDFTASTIPNAGDFSVCIEEFVPAIRMGEVATSDACSGTILDSGGEEGNYGNNENSTFTICPQTPNSCIIFDVVSYDLEFGFDVLSLYAGEDNTAPLLARISGANFGTPFPIQASSDCVTLEFISDASTTRSGFEINWECSNDCQPTSLDRATNISSLPFSGSFSSCDVPATFAETACGADVFLNGPEKIFTYTSPGDICASITISNAEENAGVIVLNAPPTDPNATCIAESETGFIQSADFSIAGTYYIVVAQPVNCVNFDISIEEADCILSPALLNALCNPLNGCLIDGGAPSEFIFQDGFQDVTLVEQNNSGCWQNEGIEADFFWFTIEAQATGKFGFILESSDMPSDIDFNVWGPFSKEDACNNKDAVIDVIENNQPIRSSWAPNAGPTGLADIHPIFRTRVRDNYDCLTPFLPSPFGDDFVQTIDAQEGEVYVVLVNDFGNDIQGNSISIDWSPSDPEVIDRLSIEIETENVEICEGESAQLKISDGIDNISWSPAESLSCNNCLDPIARPEETTLYKAIVEGVCTMDTLEILVEVLKVDPIEDITICSGEEFQLDLETDFQNATYEWIAPPQVQLSCTDCPDPIITSTTAGNYTITVNLDTENCPTSEEFTLTVLSQPAPQFEVIDSRQICEDEVPISLGSDSNPNNLQYTWSSVPAGFTSSSRNPSVSPTETTTYFIEATNGICPITAMDSVTIEVFQAPEFDLIADQSICQGDTLVLTTNEAEEGVSYQWTGPGDVFINDTLLNTAVVPQTSGDYTLIATRGACVIREAVNIQITPIGINILSSFKDQMQADEDSIRICLGEEIIFDADPNVTRPSGVIINWTPSDGSLSDTIGAQITATPSTLTTYIATVENMGCIQIDTVVVVVDSLPFDALPIMPQDTMVCEGNYVILTSTTYEPFLYPDIDFNWTPANGQQTPDSLYNMVANPDTTTTYLRETTNGACLSLDSVTVIVNPIPEIEIRPQNPAICSGEGVQLEVVPLNDVIIDPDSYMWEPEGLSCTDCPNPTASIGGSYTVMVMSDKMCPGSASVNIIELESPSIQIAQDQTICEGESVQLNFGATGGANYTWESDDPDFNDLNNPTPTVTPMVGVFTYMVTATNDQCPPEMASVTITVVSAAIAALDVDASVEAGCLGDEITLTANTSDVEGTFTWENGTEENNTSSSTTTVRLVDSLNIFGVTFTDANGCFEIMDTVQVLASSSETAVPNAFTPNGDGANDEFRLFYISASVIDFSIMQIYDRWGNLVFETNQIGVGWNGQRNNDGAQLPSDTYAYRIVYRENCGEMEEITLIGKVLLIR